MLVSCLDPIPATQAAPAYPHYQQHYTPPMPVPPQTPGQHSGFGPNPGSTPNGQPW